MLAAHTSAGEGICQVDEDEQRTSVTMELPADDAFGVSRARAELTKHARALGFSADAQDRIALAVTEACTNCVLHAYDGTSARSTYRLDARMDGADLVVVVEDSGAGIAGDGDTPDASEKTGLGWGLKLIEAAASSVEIATAVDRGTRIEMRFRPGS
jgi:anti-sigma regulatory factor (Ser/Thr protein kinase)